MLKNKISVNSQDITKLTNKAKKHQNQLRKEMESSLEIENKLRAKVNLPLVEAVSKLDKLEYIHNHKIANKIALNSLKYYLNKAKVECYDFYIASLNKTKNSAMSYSEFDKRVNTSKNILDNLFDNYMNLLVEGNVKENKIKNKKISKHDMKKYHKLQNKYREKVNEKEKYIRSLFNLDETISIPKISSLEITSSNSYPMPTSSKGKRELILNDKMQIKKAKLLFSYYKNRARLEAINEFLEMINAKVEFKFARGKAEQTYDSLLSEPNYQLGQFYKQKQLLFITNQDKIFNNKIDTKIEECKKLHTPIKKKDLEIRLDKLNKIDLAISNLEKELENISIHKQSYKNKKVRIKELNEIKTKLEKEIKLLNENINPKDNEKIERLLQQKQSHMKRSYIKQKNAGSKKEALKRIFALLKPYKLQLASIFVVIIIATGLQITSPILMNYIFSDENMMNFFILSNPSDPINSVITINSQYLFSVMGLFIGVYLLVFLFNFLTDFIASKLGGLASFILRRKIKQKIDRLPLSYFDSNSVGDLLSRVSNDIDLISSSIHQVISQTLKSFFLLTSVIIAMLVIRYELALIAIATLPLALIVVFLVAVRSQKEFVKVQKITGELNGKIEEVYSGFKVVKLFNQEDKVNIDFNVDNTRLQKAGLKSQFLAGSIQPLLNAVHNVGYVFICVAGGILQNIGAIMSFLIFLNLFQQPIQQMAQIANIFQQTLAAGNRVFEVLDAKEEVEDTEDCVIANEIEGNVVFDHIDFSYTPDKPLIRDMNLVVNKGDSIAIVGPTGAGKTTLVNLIMRFYDVTNGSLKIDNVDIRDYSRSSIRKKIGMVLQDTWLFNGTIAENIAYGKPNATREEIIEASKKARAHHFIKTLEHGYDTILNEDASNISQGQKQLITIARAILSNPSIMILDEATSSVDTRTEKALQDAMNDMMKGRTSFVIAHRLSTIKNSKLILVMKDGSIVEQGNHIELLNKKGFYAELYNSQFLGAKE